MKFLVHWLLISRLSSNRPVGVEFFLTPDWCDDRMKELTNSPFSRRRTAAFAFGALSPEEVECFLSRLNEQGVVIGQLRKEMLTGKRRRYSSLYSTIVLSKRLPRFPILSKKAISCTYSSIILWPFARLDLSGSLLLKKPTQKKYERRKTRESPQLLSYIFFVEYLRSSPS